MIDFVACEAEKSTNILHMMEDYDFDISKKLQTLVEWDKVFATILSFKDSYNDNMLRFVKSNLISMGIEKWSNGYLEFVDGVGYDFVTSDGDKIELKSGIKMFQWKAMTTTPLIMKNMQGKAADENTDLEFMTNTYDYLLVVEPGNVAITSRDKVTEHLLAKGDHISAKVPLKDMEFFMRVDRLYQTDMKLHDRIYEAMNKSLDDIDILMEKQRRKKK
jgi:hypothetical protein